MAGGSDTMVRHLVHAAGVVALALTSALAQTSEPIKGTKTPTPIKCDCDGTNPAWKLAPAITGFVDVSHGNSVADQTIAKVLYDDENIYIFVECIDPKPEGIVSRETVRDTLFNQQNNNGYPTNEDYVMVSLDPFLTRQQGDISLFAVNALGTRSAQIAGGRASKAEWSGDWEACAKKTDHGWNCEMRIPWKLIHYPPGGKTVNVGFDVSRFQYRTQTLSMWQNIGPQGFWDKEGIWTDVQLPQSVFKHTLSVLPYALGGVVNGQASAKVGVDARFLFTPELTGVATLNPDFSTIEGAIQTIQFSHTERYLNDYRPFFTEGGNNFGVNINFNNLGSFLYSGRIQDFNAGGKVYGKVAANDTIGALAIQAPDGRNDMAARYLHAFSATSSGGAMVVSTNSVGGQNTVTDVDQHFRWGKLGVEGLVANSAGPGAGGGAQQLSTYYADAHTTTVLQASEISSNFLTPLGYFPYTGYKGFFGFEDYNNTWRHGFWRNFDLSGGYLSWMTMAGGRFFNGFQGGASIETRSDIHFEFDYATDFQLGSNDNTMGLNIVYGATNRFRQFGIQATTGETGGVHSTFVAPTASVRLFSGFDLTYAGGIQNRDGVSQQHILTANYQLSPTKSVGGRMVINNADTNVYLFLHNSGEKGTEFFVIFGDPNATRTVRALQAKVVFALQR